MDDVIKYDPKTREIIDAADLTIMNIISSFRPAQLIRAFIVVTFVIILIAVVGYLVGAYVSA